MRQDASGRRRYLDATWRRADGRLVVVEIDGALHLIVRRWWDDQLRQNEIVLGADAILLRFPSIVVRTDERVVVAPVASSVVPVTIPDLVQTRGCSTARLHKIHGWAGGGGYFFGNLSLLMSGSEFGSIPGGS